MSFNTYLTIYNTMKSLIIITIFNFSQQYLAVSLARHHIDCPWLKADWRDRSGRRVVIGIEDNTEDSAANYFNRNYLNRFVYFWLHSSLIILTNGVGNCNSSPGSQVLIIKFITVKCFSFFDSNIWQGKFTVLRVLV